MNYRHELKYIVSQAQIEILKTRINGLMPLDSHVSDSGKYNIRSLYFDDYYNRCFYENENGDDPRAKYRIRIYNGSSDIISLELKRKERSKTLKQSNRITFEQAKMLCEGKYLTNIPSEQNLVKGLCANMMIHKMKPVAIVEYERIPYVYKDGNVRITFDMNISSSTAIDSFFERVIPKRPILPVGMHLLEVKFDEFLPDNIYRGLQIDNLQQTTFSKFYLCRKFML